MPVLCWGGGQTGSFPSPSSDEECPSSPRGSSPEARNSCRYGLAALHTARLQPAHMRRCTTASQRSSVAADVRRRTTARRRSPGTTDMRRGTIARLRSHVPAALGRCILRGCEVLRLRACSAARMLGRKPQRRDADKLHLSSWRSRIALRSACDNGSGEDARCENRYTLEHRFKTPRTERETLRSSRHY